MCRSWRPLRASGRVLLLVFMLTSPARAQEGARSYPPASPEAGADAFYDSFQSGRWGDLADSLHPDALALFRTRLLSVVESDPDGSVARDVFGGDPNALAAMGDRALFTRLLRGVVGYAPGMIQAMTGKRITILGHVIESDYGPEAVQSGAARNGATAHVVLRTREPLSGSAPSRISVVSLALDGGAWKVLHAEELEVIASALVAVPRPQ